MRSRLLRALTCWSILAAPALSMAGCAGSLGAPPTPFAGLTLSINPALRQPCRHPPLPGKQADAAGAPTTGVGAIEAFGVAADAELEACGARHEAVLALVDKHNALVAQTAAAIAVKWPWWRVW